MCTHIIGFIEAQGSPGEDPEEYEDAMLVYEGGERMLQTAGMVFLFCPRCGKKLKNPVGED